MKVSERLPKKQVSKPASGEEELGQSTNCCDTSQDACSISSVFLSYVGHREMGNYDDSLWFNTLCPFQASIEEFTRPVLLYIKKFYVSRFSKQMGIIYNESI